MADLLFDDEHLQVLYRRGSSGYLLCTFNEMGLRADSKTYWGRQLADRLDLACLGFVTKAPNWFPIPSLHAAIDAVLPVVRDFAVRVGYGHSQGAYAAIKAAQRLGLTKTIACCPQWSIDPAEMADRRFNPYFDPRLHRDMRIAAGDAPDALVILCDRHAAADMQHVRRIAALVPAAIINIPYSDHNTVRIVTGSATFDAIVRAAPRPDELRRLTRRARRENPWRLYTIALRAMARHPGWTFALLESGRIAPSHLSPIAQRLAEHGYGARALPYAISGARVRTGQAKALATVALCQSANHDHVAARASIDAAVAIDGEPRFVALRDRINAAGI